jgi:CRISPR-associated endonuclease/helicase Cas3
MSKISDKPSSQSRFLKQPLAWHLDQVGDLAREITRLFQPQAQGELPGLSPELVAHVLGLRAPVDSPFAWQDRAVDAVRPQADEPGEKAGPAGQGEPKQEEPKGAEDPRVGRLILNVAATGSGKTLANLKLALAASRQERPRIAVAFNLRSLTLQTFEAYAKFFPEGKLRDEFDRSFACVLGTRGGLPLKIPNSNSQGPGFLQEDEADVRELDDDEVAGFDERLAPAWLHALLRGLRERSRRKTLQMLASPVLISTMDWLVAAGEPGQQARHAKALLRMASSDLILDEVDSYDPAAAVAVLRVVFMSALFGRNVIVSSATLNAALARALIQTYQAGLKAGAALRAGGQALPMRLHIVCDSLEPVAADNPSVEEGAALYARTMQAMARVPRPVLRRYAVQEIPREGSAETRFAQAIIQVCLQLHETNVVHDARLSCRLSIGLVRVANIHRCVDVAKRLQADGRFVVCAYHSRELALRRAWREAHLDGVLQRGTPAWLDHLLELLPWLREATGNVRLVVVATPVEEVGRDHDFDWAVIEPSSMHSIVQTAGRVNRHRRAPLDEGQVNVAVLQFNYRHLRFGAAQSAFVFPGFEPQHRLYPTHDLARLLRGKAAGASQVLDASLLFDLEGRKSALAQLDEASVGQTLAPALAVLCRQEGFENHFMLREFARSYPLRDEELRIDYAVDLDPSSRLQARTAAQAERQLPGLDLRWEEAPERTWLVPSRQELLQAWSWRTRRRPGDAGQAQAPGRRNDSFFLRVSERPVAIDWTGIQVDR